ncbi:MAG: nucleotidyltransferase family protein, partial [Brevundimonas sp.]
NPQTMDAALLLARREGSIGFEGHGDFSRDEDGQLAFRGDRPSVPFAYMGVHITRPTYADNGPDGAFSLSPLWRASAQNGRLFGTVM